MTATLMRAPVTSWLLSLPPSRSQAKGRRSRRWSSSMTPHRSCRPRPATASRRGCSSFAQPSLLLDGPLTPLIRSRKRCLTSMVQSPPRSCRPASTQRGDCYFIYFKIIFSSSIVTETLHLQQRRRHQRQGTVGDYKGSPGIRSACPHDFERTSHHIVVHSGSANLEKKDKKAYQREQLIKLGAKV